MAANSKFHHITLSVMYRIPNEENKRWLVVYCKDEFDKKTNKFPLIYDQEFKRD